MTNPIASVQGSLPPHLSKEEVIEKVPEVFLHNWLYSVVPVARAYEWWDYEKGHTDFPLVAALAGYCKACNQAFSVFLNTSEIGYIKLQDVGIPKDGCRGPS